MDVMQPMGDDQLALMGCAGALLVAFTIMAISYHVGRFVRGEQRTIPGPALRKQPSATEADQPQRRAA